MNWVNFSTLGVLLNLLTIEYKALPEDLNKLAIMVTQEFGLLCNKEILQEYYKLNDWEDYELESNNIKYKVY